MGANSPATLGRVPNASALDLNSGGQLRKRSLDRAIADLARDQYGVVGRSQLRRIGLTRQAIDHRVASGRLHVVHRGVYAVGHVVINNEGRWLAAVLAGGPGAVLSHLAAAHHWGIRPSAATVTEVTTPRKLRSRPGLRFHCSLLPTEEVTTHDRIPLTTITRTLFDIAAIVSIHQLRRAVHEAEIRRLWDVLCLADLLERHPRRPGAPAVRELIASLEAGFTRGALEERFLEFVDRYRLPRPATNVTFHVGGTWIEADCVWHAQCLIVELDDHTTHRTRFAYERDRARDRALVAAGWRVIRLTWRHLRDEPDAVAADLRAALGRTARR
jgi:Transcriptional regulator, AbiEi antitoxin/Protein of unknown function (DUF559)